MNITCSRIFCKRGRGFDGVRQFVLELVHVVFSNGQAFTPGALQAISEVFAFALRIREVAADRLLYFCSLLLKSQRTINRAIMAVTKSAKATFHAPPWWPPPCLFLLRMMMIGCAPLSQHLSRLGRFGREQHAPLSLHGGFHLLERGPQIVRDGAAREFNRNHRSHPLANAIKPARSTW